MKLKILSLIAVAALAFQAITVTKAHANAVEGVKEVIVLFDALAHSAQAGKIGAQVAAELKNIEGFAQLAKLLTSADAAVVTAATVKLFALANNSSATFKTFSKTATSSGKNLVTMKSDAAKTLIASNGSTQTNAAKAAVTPNSSNGAGLSTLKTNSKIQGGVASALTAIPNNPENATVKDEVQKALATDLTGVVDGADAILGLQNSVAALSDPTLSEANKAEVRDLVKLESQSIVLKLPLAGKLSCKTVLTDLKALKNLKVMWGAAIATQGISKEKFYGAAIDKGAEVTGTTKAEFCGENALNLDGTAGGSCYVNSKQVAAVGCAI